MSVRTSASCGVRLVARAATAKLGQKRSDPKTSEGSVRQLLFGWRLTTAQRPLRCIPSFRRARAHAWSQNARAEGKRASSLFSVKSHGCLEGGRAAILWARRNRGVCARAMDAAYFKSIGLVAAQLLCSQQRLSNLLPDERTTKLKTTFALQ